MSSSCASMSTSSRSLLSDSGGFVGSRAVSTPIAMAVPGGVSAGLPVLVPTMVATVLSRGQSISGTMARGGQTSDPTESVSVVGAIVDSDVCGGDAMEV